MAMARRVAASRRWQGVIIAGCVAVAVVSTVALIAFGSRRDLLLVHVTAYSVSYLVAGSLAWMRRPANPIGPVMLAISVAGSLSFFAFHPDPLVWRPAGISGSLANVGIVWVMLAAPTGRLVPGPDRWLLAGFAVAVLAWVVVGSFDMLRVVFAGGVVVSLLLALVLVGRWRRASGASRRSLTPVVVAGVVISLVHAMDFASGVLLIPITPGGVVHWADTISRTLVPFGFLVGLLRLRMARGAVANLAVELGEMPPPDRLRAALATALGDPSLAVLYWSPPFRTYVDADGASVDPLADGTDRLVTYLERDGRPLAAILHDPALAEDPGLVAAAAAVVGLTVDNERLAAEVREQLEAVRASRARIVEASDAERRRVERNLHDGAQQRLVALSLALRRAQAQLPAGAAPDAAVTLERAAGQLTAALAELRELARGIHPAILSEAGLGPALRSLVRDSALPVRARLDVPDGLGEPTAAAAYFVVAEALANVAKYAGAGSVEVVAEVDGQQLRIEVRDDGVGGADPDGGSGLRGLADRVAALGGRLAVRSPVGGGTRVVARLPLASGMEIGP